MCKVYLPNLGLHKSEIIEIFIKEKSFINKGDCLFILESNKVSVEFVSEHVGVILNLYIKLGDFISDGDLLFKLDYSKVNVKYLENKIINLNNNGIDIPVSPSVRRLASEFSINLNLIKGTGLKNKILRIDVINYIKNLIYKGNSYAIKNSKFSEFKEKKYNLGDLKVKSGINIFNSWSKIPHVSHFTDINISSLEKYRKKFMILNKVKINFLVLVVKIISIILNKIPIFNAYLSQDKKKIIYREHINIGIVFSSKNGLLVPVLKNVFKKNILELNNDLILLKQNIDNNKFSLNSFTQSSFTISNLGKSSSGYFTPIINYPQIAILGISGFFYKPVWNKKKKMKLKLFLPLSLSYNHYVINGLDVVNFFNLFSLYSNNFSYLIL